MLHAISSYYKYLLTSTNQYGVHSPFLFSYLTKGLRNSTQVDLKKVIELRKELLRNHKEIQVTDFGVGSRIFDSNKRVVSKIAATAGISKKRGKLLTKTTNYFQPESILEIGTSLGIATAYMASGAPQATITTLEGCPATAHIAKENFQKLHLNNIEVIIGEFDQFLNQIPQDNPYDLIFFDGNHQKEATIRYFNKCLELAHEQSIFIFDDIHWSKGMEAAWEVIKTHEKVSMSVDTYKWGLVFFSKGREKQHFTIRI